MILDVRMPDMSGLELQRLLAGADSHLPIIFITAHEDDDRRTQALEAGALAFLYKQDFLPVEPQSGLSFLILLGRTKVRLKPLLLELYPSSPTSLSKAHSRSCASRWLNSNKGT
jgi:CheY-like chemotaxis protein